MAVAVVVAVAMCPKLTACPPPPRPLSRKSDQSSGGFIQLSGRLLERNRVTGGTKMRVKAEKQNAVDFTKVAAPARAPGLFTRLRFRHWGLERGKGKGLMVAPAGPSKIEN